VTESHKSESIGRLLLLVLIGVSAIGPVTMNGVLSANSEIMQEFSVDYAVVQAVVTVYLVATFVSQLILGPLADRIGRRPVMIGAMSIFVVGSVLCSLASSMEWLLVFRFVQGFGAAVCVLLPRTVVRDIYPVDKAASMIGYMTTAMMVAPLFGPFAGGWITDNYSWRLMYAGLAFLGIVFVLLAYLFQYETLADTNHAQSAVEVDVPFRRSIIELLKSRRFQGYMALQAGAVGGYFAFLAGAPYVAMENRGLSASQFGTLLGAGGSYRHDSYRLDSDGGWHTDVLGIEWLATPRRAFYADEPDCHQQWYVFTKFGFIGDECSSRACSLLVGHRGLSDRPFIA